jgi:hypothetical protein
MIHLLRHFSSRLKFVLFGVVSLGAFTCKQRIDSKSDPDPTIVQNPINIPKAGEDSTPTPQDTSNRNSADEGTPVKFAHVKSEGKFSWQPIWNQHIVEAISAYGSALTNGPWQPVTEIVKLCPNYEKGSQKQKSAFWALFFASIARYESGFDPSKRFKEGAALNYVYSEGLLQLSYGDEKNHANCPVSKAQGNILTPKANLQCGVSIMVNQIRKCQCLFTAKSFYWSVLTNKKTAIAQDMKAAVSDLGFCN